MSIRPPFVDCALKSHIVGHNARLFQNTYVNASPRKAKKTLRSSHHNRKRDFNSSRQSRRIEDRNFFSDNKETNRAYNLNLRYFQTNSEKTRRPKDLRSEFRHRSTSVRNLIQVQTFGVAASYNLGQYWAEPCIWWRNDYSIHPLWRRSQISFIQRKDLEAESTFRIKHMIQAPTSFQFDTGTGSNPIWKPIVPLLWRKNVQHWDVLLLRTEKKCRNSSKKLRCCTYTSKSWDLEVRIWIGVVKVLDLDILVGPIFMNHYVRGTFQASFQPYPNFYTLKRHLFTSVR